MELRSQELALRKDEQGHTHEYSMTALRAQVEDRDKDREHRRSSVRQYLIFAGIIVLFCFGFALAAMACNKEAVVIETFKILGPFIGGLGTGAFFGYKKGKRENESADVVDSSD